LCGIIGYAGYRDAIPEIIEGLKRLEYRGYDSAGVAVITDVGLWIEKREGRLSRLEECLNGRPQACIGVGHTRWATHGVPNDVNAHPHVDCQEEFAVVHNGIIENFGHLRRWLVQKGHVFRSQTDTEVLCHLIEDCYQGDLVEAVRKAIPYLEGSYAMAFSFFPVALYFVQCNV